MLNYNIYIYILEGSEKIINDY